MNDDLAKLLEVIEPKIRSIEEDRVEIKSLSEVAKTMDSLIEKATDSYKNIIDFEDQNFIIRAIKIGNFSENIDQMIDKYNSSKYLLKSDNQMLSELPQFKDAIDFVQYLYKYLYGLNEKIQKEYEDKVEILNVKEILNKYYNLLRKDKIFIKDIDEFLMFLDLVNISVESRKNILLLINKYNIKNYLEENDILIKDNIKLSDIKEEIDNNNKLLELNYEIDCSNIYKYLEKNIYKVEDAILNLKIYFINKLNELYLNKEYTLLDDYYNQYKYVKGIEEEIQKQETNSRKLVFLMKNDKSLVRDYIEKTGNKYKSCILKNLLDLESNNSLTFPKMCYNNKYLYVKDDFVVKTVYSFVNGFIMVLGVLDKGENLQTFVKKNSYLINSYFDNDIVFDTNERDKILKDIKTEDLVLSIDLDTLDIKTEDGNGR